MRRILSGGLLVLLFAGLLIRLDGLTKSLWLDEFSTLWAVESSFREMLHRVPEVMGQSPFFYGFVWLSVHTLGESEWALRLPSLLAIVGASLAVGHAAFLLSGRKAALIAGSMFWLSFSAIWASVDARPYGLALFFGALAIGGFIGACQRGGIWSRIAWVLGASGLIWTHYVFIPFVTAVAGAYLGRRQLRERYEARKAATDLLFIALLILPTVTQFASLVSGRQSQQWMFVANPIGMLAPLVPFALAAWFPVGRSTSDRAHRDLRLALSMGVAAQIGALAAAYLLGLKLIEFRYAGVSLVAIAVLSGDTLARLTVTDMIAPLAIYSVATLATLAANRITQGSASSAGFQEWRQAVQALRSEVALTPGAPVLYRSGNAEDDLGPPGTLSWPATLAPLRSPGLSAPTWRLVLLTYRWNSLARAAYFQEELTQRLSHEPVVFLLCLGSSEPGSAGYCGDVISWMDSTWPGRFRSRSLGRFRFLTVMRFDQPAPSVAAGRRP